MGNLRNSSERDCAGTFPTKGAWDRLSPSGEIGGKFVNLIPLRCVGEFEELTNLAVFLLSDLSSYLTGEVIYLDGGAYLTSTGQFNLFIEQPREQLLAMFERMKPTK